MKKRVILEACVDSYESAMIAKNAGASRLELCSELSVGGLTPSMGLITRVRAIPDIKLNVLIRPRSGDFSYNDQEIEVMLIDIMLAKELGANGVVFGALTHRGDLDIPTIKRLYEAAGGCSTTFHRAFDMVVNPLDALEDLIDIGVSRVLTSGQEATALSGTSLLVQLQVQANGRIIIMPGSGINAENVAIIVQKTGVTEVHASGRRQIRLKNKIDSKFGFGENTRYLADHEELSLIIKHANTVAR